VKRKNILTFANSKQKAVFCNNHKVFLLKKSQTIKYYLIVTLSINDKAPSECTNISEVRNEIDNIDREIIRLISQRFGYVREVVKYKDNTATAIEASDRKQAVMRTRREWAAEQGLNPDVIENIYTQLVQYFIEEEKKIINI